MRPTLFIGSSSESRNIAYAAQSNLEDTAECAVWAQGLFSLTKSYLESLLDALDDSEFGLFIFETDDVTNIRGANMRTARDNVVFELGLFIGRLGRERTFIIMPKGIADFHLPSDLLGIHTATFQPASKPNLLQAALGPACNEIRTAIGRQTLSRKAGAATDVNDLGLVLPVLLPEPEQRHLLNIAHGKTKDYRGRGSLRSELRHLRSLGLIQTHSGRHVGDLTSGEVRDIADVVELTELGRQWSARLDR
jgi:Predicted nucleotide-binding protein containing TIR-like domain